MTANSLPAVQVPDDKEIGACLWNAYKYIIALGKRRKERLARQTEAAGQGEPAGTQTQKREG